MKTTRPIFPEPPSPITTARLLLRPMKQSDINDFHVLRTQIQVMVHTSTGKVDADLEATQTWMNRSMPPNDATTFNFAIEERQAPGRVIGVMGCHIAEPPECGYMFRSEHWGKGYATEALKQWLQTYWSLPRREVEVPDEGAKGLTPTPEGRYPEVLLAVTEINNEASEKVVGKCGFKQVYDEQAPDNFGPGTVTLLVHHLHRPDLS